MIRIPAVFGIMLALALSTRYLRELNSSAKLAAANLGAIGFPCIFFGLAEAYLGSRTGGNPRRNNSAFR